MKSGLDIRIHKLLSQQDLADFLQVSRSYINMYEQGKRSLPKEAWDKLMQLELAWLATGKEPEEVRKTRDRKAASWDKSGVFLLLSERIEQGEGLLKDFEDQLNHMKKEHQKLLRWREVLEKFRDNQLPGRREGIEKWMEYYLLKVQKKIDAVDPKKQFLLQFSMDTLKAEIRVTGEAIETLRMF